jgi:hypothetical protein
MLLSKDRGPVLGQSSLHGVELNIYKAYSHDRTNCRPWPALVWKKKKQASTSYEIGRSVKGLAKIYLPGLYLSSCGRNAVNTLTTPRKKINYTGMGNVSKNYKWKEYLIFIQVNET